MTEAVVLDLEDDRPIAVRRERRSSARPIAQRDFQPKSEGTSTQGHSILTPPATPHRSKKRVRFSGSEPSLTTGLTPFLKRTYFSPPPSKSPRRSTPSRCRDLSADDSPIILRQFRPLRDVLQPRAIRRLRRNHLSEEVNTIQMEKRLEKKACKEEIERLKEELRQKDADIQLLNDEQDVASQICLEAGIESTNSPHTDERVRGLQLQIRKLRAELQKQELDTAAQLDPKGTMAADNQVEEDMDFIPNYDDDFNVEMTDVFLSTPARRSFRSPPATVPNTPSKPRSTSDPDDDTIDVERVHLDSQLEVLQDEVKALAKALELTNTAHERLTVKLSSFLPEPTQPDEHHSLDAALDTVLTQLVLSQSRAADSCNRFSALTSEIEALFPSSTSRDPEYTIQLLHNQFRAARLELEYIAPGENPEGFENSKLLDMLVSRLRVLTRKLSQQDDDIDQYHSQELSLRQQLDSRVDAMNALQSSLASAKTENSSLESTLQERDESISKLTHALQGYRDEVAGLETLITRLEGEHNKELDTLRCEISNITKQAESKLLGSELQRETLQAVSDVREILMLELERRLSDALSSIQALEGELTKMKEEASDKDSTITRLQQSTLEREKQHGDALALRDARVAELRQEIERINASLKEAHESIMTLKREKRELTSQVEDEKARYKFIIDTIRGQLVALETETGCLSGDSAALTPETGGDETASPVVATGMDTLAVPCAKHGSATIIRPGGLFDDQAARTRRGSTGQGKKRRRYDSGLGFLEEEDGS